MDPRKYVIISIIFLMLTSSSPAFGDWADSFTDTTKVEWTKNAVHGDGNYTVNHQLFSDNFTGMDGSGLDSKNWSSSTRQTGEIKLKGNRVELSADNWADTLNGNQAKITTIKTFNHVLVDVDLDILGPDIFAYPSDIVQIGVYKAGGIYATLYYNHMNGTDGWTVYTKYGNDRLSTDFKTGLHITLDVAQDSFTPIIRFRSNNSILWSPGTFDLDYITDVMIHITAENGGCLVAGCHTQAYFMDTYWDNFTAVSAYERAIVRSKPITLPNNRLWDKVYINSTIPDKTFINVSVLDGDNNTMPGFNNITTSPIDISTILKTTNKIKLCGFLDGNYTMSSPVLKDWNVTWMPDIPVQDSLLPDIHIAEDSKNKTFDLTGYFSDNYTTPKSLVYTLSSITPTKNITVSLANGVLKVSTNKTDWNGEATTITIGVSDGEFAIVSNSFKVTVDPVNDKPVITSVHPTGNATVGKSYYYNVTATDADHDALSFGTELISDSTPEGMSIDSITGKLVYNPDVKDNGSFVTVHVFVTDLHSPEVWQNYSLWVDQIIVKPPPHPNDKPPVIISKTPTLVLLVGDVYSYQVIATDPDNDTLYYGLDKTPTGMSINPSTGLIAWTATVAGNYTVTINVSDGNLSDAQTFVLHVQNTPGDNHAPIITSTAPTKGKVNETYSYTVEAYDPDGDNLTYQLVQRPKNHTMSLVHKFSGGLELWVIEWSSMVAGNYPVEITVSDYQYIAKQYWNITVEKNDATGTPPKNHVPIISNTETKFVIIEGQTWNLTVVATDQDNNVLTYSLTGPSGMTIFDTTGWVNWANPIAGNYTVTVKVSDGKLTANFTFQLEVDKEPIIVPPPLQKHNKSLLDNPIVILTGMAIGTSLGGVIAFAYIRRKKKEVIPIEQVNDLQK